MNSPPAIHRILRDDYYTGIVTRGGVKLPGRHEAIVNRAIFARILIQVIDRRVDAEGEEYEVYALMRGQPRSWASGQTRPRTS